MHCKTQTCWELLHSIAHHCELVRNDSQHCCANNVGSCCARLHAASVGTTREFQECEQIEKKLAIQLKECR